MIRVGVSGGAGRLGRVLADAIDAADDLDLRCVYAPGHADEGFAVAAEAMAECEVVVEVTNPDVVMDNLDRWRSFGCHTVVGTSGFDAARLESLRNRWRDTAARCLVVPNFALGAVLMMRFAAMAAPHFEGAEIVELHHAGKRDAPSGTALATAARMRRAAQVDRSDDPPARGMDVDGVAVHSVRLPGLVAHQQVMLGNPGELLTITHDTNDRTAFVPGALLAIRRVGDLDEPVTVGLDRLIFDD